MRKPCSLFPGGYANRPLTIAKQSKVSVTRDKSETYYSVKPDFSETRLRRDQIFFWRRNSAESNSDHEMDSSFELV